MYLQYGRLGMSYNSWLTRHSYSQCNYDQDIPVHVANIHCMLQLSIDHVMPTYACRACLANVYIIMLETV